MKTRTRRRSKKLYSKATFGYKNRKTKRTYKRNMRKIQKGG